MALLNENGLPKNRPLTFGEEAVGINFNPSNDPNVQGIKMLYAQIIDALHSLIMATDNNPEKVRYLLNAINEAQTAQMWAVKGITK